MSTPIPQKREELIDLGYEFNGEGRCKRCHQEIEWWINPNGKHMPFTVQEVKDAPLAPVKGYIRVLHFNVCKPE